MARLQIGSESFREIREKDLCYVDKTSFLEDFFYSSFIKVSLIARPRRFGKTLMMSMLHDFFDIRQDSRALFEGLAISKNKEICDKWMNQCPVVFLTFKGIEGQTFEDALKKIRSRISNICIEYSFLSDSISVDKRIRERLSLLKAESAEDSMLSDSLKTLCMALYAHYGKPAILLIDEYDVPLAKAYNYGYYDKMSMFLRDMLDEGLKTNTFLEFGILTGCLRISGESFFTGLNNFKCFGISDEFYADKFGFTSEEVDDLLAATGFSEKKEEIKAWYDGYLFGDDTEIYCPWDILQYVDDLQVKSTAMPKAY
ncbi:MAG: AAA family ATPase, partial [Desulfovibrionaceae bacterium]|nr:AAA family ATPase [Desulfovibrionaceae bacterium]